MRSKAAAQLLLSDDFTNVYNMSGGIIAYQGGKAIGAETQGMEYFVSKDFADIYQMSYAMEEGLQQLYLAMEELVEDPEAKELLNRLARLEDGHKAKLKSKFPDSGVGEKSGEAESLEGGFNKQQILDHFRHNIGSLESIIQLGMMLETQALDLYTRLSRTTEDKESKSFFEYMAKEEKQHLHVLSNEYDIRF